MAEGGNGEAPAACASRGFCRGGSRATAGLGTPKPKTRLCTASPATGAGRAQTGEGRGGGVRTGGRWSGAGRKRGRGVRARHKGEETRDARVCAALKSRAREAFASGKLRTRRSWEGVTRPALSSSPASARQVSGLPCTAPRAPPATPASAGKSHRKRISRTQAATPRHATPAAPVTPLAPRTSSFRVFSGAQVKEGSRHVTTETTLCCGASRAPWGARPQPWPRPTTGLALTRSTRKCLQMFRMFFGWENNSQVNSSTLRRRL